MKNYTQLDLDLLQGYIDNLGKAVVEQMLQLYVSQSAIYIEEITSFIDADNQKMWQESCHKMKGAAGSVGLIFVHKKLASIEKSEEDKSIKLAHLDELKALNLKANEEFANWLSKA